MAFARRGQIANLSYEDFLRRTLFRRPKTVAVASCHQVFCRRLEATATLIFIALILATLPSTGKSNEAYALAPETKENCLSVLREGMRGDDFWPAIHAAEALTLGGHSDEVQAYLEPKLEIEKDDQRRCGLARELVRSGDAAKTSVMLKILEASDPHGHIHAAESLYKVGYPGDDAPIRKAFRETVDIRLKLMAAAALGKHGQGPAKTEALAFLRQNLETEPDPEIFRLSAWVLGRIGEDKDRALIRSRLGDAKAAPLVHAFLEHALAALGDPEGRAAVLQNLKSSDPAIRTYAAVFAGESGFAEAAPLLILQLDDVDLDARIRAAQALLELAK